MKRASEDSRRETDTRGLASDMLDALQSQAMRALLVERDGSGAPLAAWLEGQGVDCERAGLEAISASTDWRAVDLLVVALPGEREAIESLACRFLGSEGAGAGSPFVLVWWPLRDEGGEPPDLGEVPHDFLFGAVEERRFGLRMRVVLHRARELERLRRSEAAFRNLVSGVPDGVVVCVDGVVRYANAAALRLLGAPDMDAVVGRPARELLHSEGDRVRCESADLNDPVEVRLCGPGGVVCTVELRRQAVSYDGREAVLVLFQDVSQRKEAETRRLLTDRMAAVGTLAAGVAHELNNPLSFVFGNVQLLQERLRDVQFSSEREREEVVQALADSLHGLERMRRVIRDMRVFSRADQEDAVPEPVDVRAVLESALGLCRSDLSQRARVDRCYEEVPMVAADEARLGQVFLNLLVNAIQALPEHDAERQRVRVEVFRDEEGWVVVAVQDSGPGISSEVMPRIFDPFFSTKHPGEGTGLGLSICRSIVASLGGSIHVESRPGEGARFEVRLPPVDAIPGAAARRSARRRGSSAQTLRINRLSSGRALRILLVDDEPMVIRSIKRWMRDWDVQVAHGGQEALDLLARDASFDCVLCDMMMPRVDGVAFYEAVAARWPDLAPRIVFVTGGAFTERARRFFDRVDNERVDKPFDPAALRELVRLVALGVRN